MSETPHSDALQAATEAIVAAFQLPPTEERTQAILAAYLEHDRARANALSGSINHLAVLFEQHTRTLVDYQDRRVSEFIADVRGLRREVRGVVEQLTDAMRPIHDRYHTLSNMIQGLVGKMDEQAEYVGTFEVRLAEVEERVIEARNERARILRELADIRQQLAVGGEP